MADLEDVRWRLREIVQCPIDWRTYVVSPSLRDSIIDYWGEFVEAYQVDFEGAFVDEIYFVLFGDLHHLEPALKNWEHWGPEAKIAFWDETRHLVELRMVGRDEYPKHYPRLGLTHEEVLARTEREDSLLYPSMDPEHQLAILQEVIGNHLDDFLIPSHQIIHVDAGEPVGGARGLETTILCYDLHFPGRLGHSYPALAREMAGGARLYEV